MYIQNSDTHEASLHHQMDENGKDLFSGQESEGRIQNLKNRNGKSKRNSAWIKNQ